MRCESSLDGYVRTQPVVLWGLALLAVFSIFGFSYAVLLSVIAHQTLGQGARGFGILMSAGGGGAFAGAVLLATFAGHLRKGHLLLAGSTLASLGLLGLGMSRTFEWALLALPCVGGGLVITTSIINSLIQEQVPDVLRGRVVSIWAFIFAGFMPLGALYAGSVAHLLSPSLAVALGGGMCLLMLLLVTLRARWMWRVR